MTTPLLSVVIPTWNRARLVCEAVDSALSQRLGEVEVIVVDDASTDNTVDVLAQTFGLNINLLRLPKRRGPGAARNVGAQMATGEFLAFLDSDDLWLPGKLDAELSVFKTFPNAEVVLSDSQGFLEGQANGGSRFAQNGLLAAIHAQVGWMNDCGWLWTNSTNTVGTSSMTLRRSVFANTGEKIFAEDLTCCEDWEFQMRVYHRCRVVVLPEILIWVRGFTDDSRPGRAVPGKPRTLEQEIGLLRDRLTVMERSHWLTQLPEHLALEFERFRRDTTSQLAQLVGAKKEVSEVMMSAAT